MIVRSDLQKDFASGGAVIWVTFQKVCAAFGVFKVVSSISSTVMSALD